MNGIRIAFFGHFINLGTAWIFKTDYSGYLIIGFTYRIIQCCTNNLKGIIIFHINKLRMSPTYNQCHNRILQWLDKFINKDMTL